MTAQLRALVREPALDNNTENDITNTWHFQTTADTPSATDLTAITNALASFYQTIDDTFLTQWVQVNWTVKYYNMADPKPRVPIGTYTIGPLTLVGSTYYSPPELCIVLSYKGLFVSGTPQARRRGRIYLGPITTSAFTGAGVVAASSITKILSAANGLLSASDLAANWTWCGYSRASDPAGTGLNGFWPVIGGWVDNAVDIQRRRGIKPTARSVWP